MDLLRHLLKFSGGPTLLAGGREKFDVKRLFFLNLNFII